MTHNTDNTPARNTKVRGRCWGPCTWNNYSEDDLKNLQTFCEAFCEDYAINREIGESGTPHLQFCMKFKNARTFDALKKCFPEVHLEVAKKWVACKQYCMKAETSEGPCITPIKDENPYAHVTDNEFVNDNLELFEYQQIIEDLMSSPVDRRKILWIWEPDGNRGKTSFIRHLILKNPRQILFVSGKSADIKYAMMESIKKKHNIKMVVFHCVRSMEQYISYEAIESIKDGIFFSGKYEAGMVIFNRPHCLCLANFYPETNKLSNDRWDIIEL